MAGLPTNQRDQILLAVAFLAVIGAGAYWYFVDDPLQATFVAKQAHIDTLNASNQKARAQLARGTVATIRAEADSLRANLDVMRTLVPASNEVPALVEQVSNAARRARLELAALDPQPPIEGEMFDTYRYRIKLNGSYHEIGTVLSNIASLNRVIAPINLNLIVNSGSSAKRGPGKEALAGTFEIQTYVVRTQPKAKAGGPPAKAAPKPEGDK
jgi:type IV pilus assembly protein PilO